MSLSDLSLKMTPVVIVASRFRLFPVLVALFTALFSLLFVFIPLGRYALAIELTAEEEQFVAQSSPIRVHNESDWPPFNFYENGRAQGLSIDVMNRIAEMTGLTVEYISGPSWNDFLGMMRDGQLDVMLNIIDLPERRKELLFTTNYSKSIPGIFTTMENSDKTFTFADLKGKTVAIIEGFDVQTTLPKYYPEIKLLPVKDILACIDAVRSGRADAFMDEISVVDYMLSQRMISDLRLAFQVNEEPFVSTLSIATSHESGPLFSIIQKGLNAIPAEDLHQLRKKWLHETYALYEQSMVDLSVAEKEYLYLHPEVKICVDPTWPPLDFINDEGVHSGLSADLINKVATRVDVALKLIPTATWQETLDNVKTGVCDVIPLMNETDEAKEYIDFTQPYFEFATVIATRDDAPFIADYTDLYGKKVALQAYYFITEFVRKNHPQIEIIEVENTLEALKLVSEQKAFATIDGLPNIVNKTEALALENIQVSGSVPQENRMKLGVSKGNELLLSIFEKGIGSLTEREKIGLYRKWFDTGLVSSPLNRRWLIRVSAAGIIIIAFLLWRQFILSRYAATLKKLNEKLSYTATTDHLTAIANRRSIEKQLALEIQKTKLIQNPLSVVLLDIDHFKRINDTYGHISGDKVLKAIAALMTDSIRATDHVGRWGGEEFLLILPGTGHLNAEKLALNLKGFIEKHDFGLGSPVSASFGIAQLRDDETVTDLLARTDSGLYRAKDLGRNLVVNMEHKS
jgi:polar amino acid transport system substrate-binding protein